MGTLPSTLLSAGGAVAVAFSPTDAWARRASSGGYSRPSSSAGSSSSLGSTSQRTPSFSGGYERPRTPDVGASSAPSSAGDRALSRAGSAGALNDYRQRTPAPASANSGATGPASGGFGNNANTGWYRNQGWAAPSYAYAAPPRFGLWNGLFLWFMLDHLTSPAHGAFFYNHQDDPGYQQWRAEADRQARDNADLRTKLDQLDGQLAAQQGKPRDPNYLPPDVPADAAMAEPAPKASSGSGTWWLVPLLLALLFLLWRARRHRAAPSPAPTPSRKDTPVGPLNTLGNMLRQKISGQAYTPSLFRVGMALTIDPTPFLLAATKVTPPVAGGSQMTSVEAVGTLVANGVTLHRLYLPGGAGFFQIHLDDSGFPDECRYFSVIDEVHPADADEWAFWLDATDGMIGWAEFQTKDGKIYPRLWEPGLSRVSPQKFGETVQAMRGAGSQSSQAMLYGAPIGAPPPAPQTEYILVEAVEQPGRAWVQIAAGIDVNPASLSLS